MKHRFLFLCCVAALILLNLSVSEVNAGEIDGVTLFVTPTGSGGCTTWGDACGLQTALGMAADGDQVWVAAGIYYPTDTNDRDISFNLISGVAIYGGFAGSETALEQRNWVTNITILSGDIGTPDVIADNSIHVVQGITVNSATIIDGFTITAGNATDLDGGGMFLYQSNPTLSHLIFTENTATNLGGGLFNNYGSPTLTDVTFIDNTVTNYGGGGMYSSFLCNPILNDVTFTNNSAVYGGGLYVYQSAATLTNLTFTGNTATYGGGLATGYGGNFVLTDAVFSANHGMYGGGVYVDSATGTSMLRVSFQSNTANSGGGLYVTQNALSMTEVDFNGNTATVHGGGIFSNDSSFTLSSANFTGNSAVQGAGIYNQNYAHPNLSDVTFSANEADNGGGMYNANNSNPSLNKVTFTGNSAVYSGAGLYNYENCSPTLTNVTFSANIAGSHGGGIYNYNASNPTLTNVTLTGNSATFDSGGMYNYNSSPAINNTIFWANSPDQAYNGGTSLPTISYSLVQDGCPTGASCSDIITTDPFLGALADNGGFTMTHALGETSPAIDAGDPDPLSCPEEDQRGIFRPIDGNGSDGARCDIGAYEYAFVPLEISIVGNGSVSKDPDQPLYEFGETVSLTAISAPGWIFTGWSGDVTSTDNPLTLTIGDHTQLVATFVQDIRFIFLPLIIK